MFESERVLAAYGTSLLREGEGSVWLAPGMGMICSFTSGDHVHKSHSSLHGLFVIYNRQIFAMQCM